MNNNKLSHVAFILDGNKRWAKSKGKTVLYGYKNGFEKIKEIINFSLKINLKELTLFTLSSENYNRSTLNIIYDIILVNFSKLLEEIINDKKIKIKIIGNREKLPKKISDIFYSSEKLTKSHKKLNLNIAFNYGFKDEIRYVLQNYNLLKKEINLHNEKEIKKLFYLGKSSDPDLLIRTGGYSRLSNFIMYNLTYTELFFTNTLWPDFSIDEFNQIINNYNKISRKYGL